jgi:hypothetical protein
MIELDAAERQKLSRPSAGFYEARLFAERNPDYFVCPANSQTMIEYLEKHKLEPTYDNFLKAFTALKKQHRILPAGEAIARMSPEEFQKMAAEIGTPVRNYAGKIVGYDLPYQVTQQATGGRPLLGREALDYQKWCDKNNFDPETGERKK